MPAATALPLWLTSGAWQRHAKVGVLLPSRIAVRHLIAERHLLAAELPAIVVFDAEEAGLLASTDFANPLIGLFAVRHSGGTARQVVDLLDRGVDRVLIAPADPELAVQIRKLTRRLRARTVSQRRTQPAPLPSISQAAS